MQFNAGYKLLEVLRRTAGGAEVAASVGRVNVRLTDTHFLFRTTLFVSVVSDSSLCRLPPLPRPSPAPPQAQRMEMASAGIPDVSALYFARERLDKWRGTADAEDASKLELLRSALPEALVGTTMGGAAAALAQAQAQGGGAENPLQNRAPPVRADFPSQPDSDPSRTA